jgi:hypothetical protein
MHNEAQRVPLSFKNPFYCKEGSEEFTKPYVATYVGFYGSAQAEGVNVDSLFRDQRRDCFTPFAMTIEFNEIVCEWVMERLPHSVHNDP